MKLVDRPEVLAPAGDRAALLAAIRGGADAVYLGLKGFNARARAGNFDTAELEESMRTLHAHGVRGYVTLNTLVFDSELPAVAEAIRAAARAGADAIIVQDLAVAQLARRIAPDLPVHASTQMTCADAGACELARELGASRVILARELSIEDVARIREASTVPVEVFVHGALCIAYSGQCLTSEAIGGRSANRGACAQACRLPYELVVDGARRGDELPSYLLSPQDLDASELVPRLVAAGVASLKIEGRLKGPEYVEATTRLYRAAVDGAALDGARRDRALQTYSRGSGPGFFEGVDHQTLVDGETCDHRGIEVGALVGVRRGKGKRWLEIALERALKRGDGVLVAGDADPSAPADRREIGGRIWAIEVDGADVAEAPARGRALVWLGPDAAVPDAPTAGRSGPRRVFRTDDPAIPRALAAERPHKVRVDVAVRGAIGEPAVLSATTSRGQRAVVALDAPTALADRGVTAEVLEGKLGRLEPTPFELGALTVDLPDRALVPLSALNRARRELVAELSSSTHRAHAVTAASADDLLAALPPAPPPAPPGLFVLCRTLEQAEAAVAAGAAGVYLDFLELTGTGAAFRALKDRGAPFVGVAPPRIRKPGEEKIDRYLASLDPDAVLVRGLGALHEGAASRALRVGDFSLNVTNRVTARTVLARGLAAFTPSFDLDAEQLARLVAGELAPVAEIVVHHPMPLFHMEHCVIAHALSDGADHRTCGRPCERHRVSLRDRAGMEHPVEADVGCRNTVFHQKPQSAAELVPGLLAAGARRFRIELVREGADAVRALVETYGRLLRGDAAPRDVWKTLRVEGGYGVVRGSLRVLP